MMFIEELQTLRKVFLHAIVQELLYSVSYISRTILKHNIDGFMQAEADTAQVPEEQHDMCRKKEKTLFWHIEKLHIARTIVFKFSRSRMFGR